jgi:hypothetical protein
MTGGEKSKERLKRKNEWKAQCKTTREGRKSEAINPNAPEELSQEILRKVDNLKGVIDREMGLDIPIAADQVRPVFTRTLSKNYLATQHNFIQIVPNRPGLDIQELDPDEEIVELPPLPMQQDRRESLNDVLEALSPRHIVKDLMLTPPDQQSDASSHFTPERNCASFILPTPTVLQLWVPRSWVCIHTHRLRQRQHGYKRL